MRRAAAAPLGLLAAARLASFARPSKGARALLQLQAQAQASPRPRPVLLGHRQRSCVSTLHDAPSDACSTFSWLACMPWQTAYHKWTSTPKHGRKTCCRNTIVGFCVNPIKILNPPNPPAQKPRSTVNIGHFCCSKQYFQNFAARQR